jgi:Prokaryotic E2 family E
MGPLEIHVQRLVGRFPDVQVSEVPGAGTMVTLPALTVPLGWNKQSTSVHFFAPVGYPFAKPDCFWADEDLRLASGALPQNANCENPMPGLGKRALWFSWHMEQWNASRDSLLTWLASINERLARAV